MLSKQEYRERKTDRQKAIANILLAALDSGDRKVSILLVRTIFPPHLQFQDMPKLHYFVNSLPLTIEHQGSGKGRETSIILDVKAVSFITDTLHMKLENVLRLTRFSKRKPAPFMSLAEFAERLDNTPEFAPLGDPVFHLTTAPRLS